MDNGEEAVILGRGGRRIGSLQGRVTTVGPWSVFKKYVDDRGDIFEQDDLASFYVFKDLGTQETLPLRYWAAAKAPYTRAEDGVMKPGPLRKLCIFKDGRRYFAVSASFYPYETIRKHQLQQEDSRDDSDVTEAEEKDALEELLLACCVGGSAQTQKKTLDYHGYSKVFHAQGLPQPRLEDVALAVFTIGDDEVQYGIKKGRELAGSKRRRSSLPPQPPLPPLPPRSSLLPPLLPPLAPAYVIPNVQAHRIPDMHSRIPDMWRGLCAATAAAIAPTAATIAATIAPTATAVPINTTPAVTTFDTPAVTTTDTTAATTSRVTAAATPLIVQEPLPEQSPLQLQVQQMALQLQQILQMQQMQQVQVQQRQHLEQQRHTTADMWRGLCAATAAAIAPTAATIAPTAATIAPTATAVAINTTPAVTTFDTPAVTTTDTTAATLPGSPLPQPH